MNVDLAVVKLSCGFQKKICLNPATLRQSGQQQRCAKACPPRLCNEATSPYTWAMTPLLLLCLSWRHAYDGTQGFFWGAKRGSANNRGVGGVWSTAHSASCQGWSCAKSGDKEGELVLNWAVVQSMVEVGGRGNVGTRLTKAFMCGGGPQRTKRHRDRLFPPAKTVRHSGIWDSIHQATAKIFQSERLRELQQLVDSPVCWFAVQAKQI